MKKNATQATNAAVRNGERLRLTIFIITAGYSALAIGEKGETSIRQIKEE